VAGYCFSFIGVNLFKSGEGVKFSCKVVNALPFIVIKPTIISCEKLELSVGSIRGVLDL
jgi:hypothetical protein